MMATVYVRAFKARITRLNIELDIDTARDLAETIDESSATLAEEELASAIHRILMNLDIVLDGQECLE